MSRAEFLSWIAFHRAFPFDDLYRYHRPAGLVAHALNPRNRIEDLVAILVPPPDPEIPDDVDVAELSDVDLSVIRAFGTKG